MIRFVFFALLACGLTGFGVVAWLASTSARPPAAAIQPARETVLVAAHSITAGSLLKPEDFAVKAVVTAEKSDDLALNTSEVRRNLIGAMTRRSLASGDPIRKSDLIRPGEHGFLAAALHEGMRAVTITVDAATGQGELISPGDKIDLILTQSLAAPNVQPGRRIAAETILSDVRVLAIDQRLVIGAAAARPENQRGRTVTLEVTEEQAQRISVARELGHLSMSVRPADTLSSPPAPRQPGGTVWAVDVSPALGLARAPAPPDEVVRVFQGAGEVKEFKF